MKKLILLAITALSFNAHAQFFQRYFYTAPVRNETFADGLCTVVNLGSTSTTNYNIGWGTSFVTSSSDTSSDVRFVKTNKNGTTVNAKTGASFKDNTATGSTWFNATGTAICEIARTGNAGGFLGVGSVADNSKTNAIVPGASDGLLTKISGSGAYSSSFRYDFANGKDVFTSIVRSKTDTNRFYICGYSEKPTSIEVIVMAVKSNGAIIWSNTYHLNGAHTTVQAKAFGIDEIAGNKNIVVVGSFYDALDVALTDGFVMILNSKGSVLHINRHNLGTTTDVYRNVIQTQTANRLAMCGYSNYNGSGPAYYDCWLTLTDTLGNIVSSYKYRHRDALGSFYESKGYDLIEVNTVVFITGPVYTPTDTLLGLYKIYSSTPSTPLHEPMQYVSQKYDNAYGISNAYAGADSLIRLFSGTDIIPTSGISSSYMIGTNFLGNSCGYCFINQPYNFPDTISKPTVTVTKVAAGGKILLASSKHDCLSGTICTATSACPSRTDAGNDGEIEIENTDDNLNVFPNPASDKLYVSINSRNRGEIKIEVTDITGRTVITKTETEADMSQYTINITNLEAGIYFVKINSGNETISKRFLKQ